jgi:hypothetical protein
VMRAAGRRSGAASSALVPWACCRGRCRSPPGVQVCRASCVARLKGSGIAPCVCAHAACKLRPKKHRSSPVAELLMPHAIYHCVACGLAASRWRVGSGPEMFECRSVRRRRRQRGQTVSSHRGSRLTQPRPPRPRLVCSAGAAAKRRGRGS